LDRIDLHVEVPQVKFREMTSEKAGESSAEIRDRVICARKKQQARFAHKKGISCNARMGSRELKSFCVLDEATKELPKRDAIRKYRDEQLANAGMEAAVLERDRKSAIRYRTLADEEVRSALQK
jgi:predicted ATPase with chaperone activity